MVSSFTIGHCRPFVLSIVRSSTRDCDSPGIVTAKETTDTLGSVTVGEFPYGLQALATLIDEAGEVLAALVEATRMAERRRALRGRRGWV